MPDSYEPYEVYAIRYAERDAMHNDHILNPDPHNGPSPMDYFVWAIVGNGRTIIVDIGFEEKEATARGRNLMRRPAEGLKAIGIDSTEVEDVVVTHLHYDHAGTVSDFPKAKFYLQEREMQFATGKHMTSKIFNVAYALDYVIEMSRMVYDNRVVFVDGTKEIAPGVTLHHVGGHTDGLQVVRVPTKRGWVVLASDASHYYMNMRTPNPFPLVYSVGLLVQGHKTMETLADSRRHVPAGHAHPVLDADVLERLAEETSAEVMPSIVQVYAQHVSEAINEFEAALANRDTAALEAVAHRIGSSSGSLGAMRLFATCRAIEAAVSEGDPARGLALAADIRRLTEASVAEIQAYARSRFGDAGPAA